MSGERHVGRSTHHRRFAVALVAASLFAGALGAFALGSGGAGAASSTTLHPDADTYVDSSNPSTNYGARDLRVDGSPVVNSYLRFTVPAAIGSVVSAQLRIYARSSQSTGVNVSTVASNTWSETGTTWSNAPAIGSVVDSTGAVTTGTWLSVDVTAAVPGSGTFSFAVTTTGSTALALSSKESTAPVAPPELVVNSSDTSSTTAGNSTTTVTTGPTTTRPSTTTVPPSTTTAPPTTTTTIPSGGGDPVIAIAGDIACDPKNSNFNNGNGSSSSCHMKQTSDLIVGHGYAAVLPLGDNQYYCGGLAAWQQSYDPTWGRVKSITHPSVGNHEYITSTSSSAATGCDSSNAGADGYYTYFGSRAGAKGSGYYSYNIGSWHLIALNTNCGDAGGCSPSSPQGKWLTADLANNTQPCTLAYMHIPLFSSGGRANQNSKTFWDQLYAAHADVVLTAHDHTYERFAQQTPSGSASSSGLREFVVGTGGANHTSFVSKAPNSQLFNADTFGILAMTLSPTSYSWTFVHEPGRTFTDSGTTACHNAGSLAAMAPFG
jgi:hypothetical protein